MRVLVFFAFLLVFACRSSAGETPLQLLDKIAMPGVTGRIDHMAVDTAGKRLYVAAFGNNSLEVVDLQRGKRIQTISPISEPQGVVLLGSGRMAVSSGGDGTCLVFDTATLTLITRLDQLEDADNLRYDGRARQLYVAYGKGKGALGIFDDSFRKIGAISLPGHPESFALNGRGGRIFINVPAIRSIVVADAGEREKIDAWKLKDAGGNFAMAFDEANHLLFVATREPAQLLSFDSRSGEVVATVPLDGDPDDLFVDAKRRRIYVSCGAGYIDVVERDESGRYETMTKVSTAGGARTSLFVPEMQRLFLAVPHRGQQEAEVWVYKVPPEQTKRKRPAASVPDTPSGQ